jgi:transposase
VLAFLLLGSKLENVGFMDEMRAGLIPCVRRTWIKKGKRGFYYYQTKYEWIYVYSIVFPFTGKTFTWFFNTVNKKAIKHFFTNFCKHNAGKYLIFWDGAGFHQESDFLDNDDLDFVTLPPYSPELNPAERLWTKYREYISNKSYETLKDLKKDLYKAHDHILENCEEIRSMTLYHWMKNIA